MLLGICGLARHGKDSAAQLLVDEFGYTKIAFADPLRAMMLALDPLVQCFNNDPQWERYSDVIKAIGYEEAKRIPDVRRLLQRLGTEAVRGVLGDNTWVDHALRRARQQRDTVISDVRFPNEVEAIKQEGGYIIRVQRPNFDNGLSLLHPSEAQVTTMRVDADIEASTLYDLYSAMRALPWLRGTEVRR